MGCLGDAWGSVWGHLSVVNGNQRRSDAFEVYLGSPSLQYGPYYGAKILILQSPQRYHFLSPDYTETLKYQNLPICPFKKLLSYAISCIF